MYTQGVLNYLTAELKMAREEIMQQERKVIAAFPFNCPVCGIQVVITVWSDGTKECSYMTSGVCQPLTAGCALI